MEGRTRFQIPLQNLPELPDDWSWMALGKITTEPISYGIVQPGEDSPNGIPVVRVTDIRNGIINTQNPLRVTPSVEAKHARTRLIGGELLLSVVGTLGESAIVPSSLRGWNVNRAVSVLRFMDDLTTNWVQLVLRMPLLRFYMETWANTTVQKTFNLRDVAQLPIPWPPRSEQQSLVHILGTLDNKIELNRRMNETLEAMARVLFKSWFVDFDPVRAKAEGRWRQGESLPGLPAHLFDLFPDSFEDSELGEIPKGWGVTSIGAVAEVIDCLHSKKPERRDSGFPLLHLENIRDDGLLDMEDTYYIAESDYEKWITRMEASPGDCVITNVGRVGAVSQIPLGQRAALGRNMTGLRCLGDFPYPTVLLECLLSCKMKDEIALKMDTGTILDALNVRNIPLLRFVKATCDVLNVFERLCRPSRRRMEMLLGESRTLASLRDTLLPKLISGEIRVCDAGGSVERSCSHGNRRL